ncbi:hypothetical protein F4861DRAFT_544049 [Xylaria intraflava]|nr:hypothetical protein F4861DRAFT_544049 [Xylaria intraflava]
MAVEAEVALLTVEADTTLLVPGVDVGPLVSMPPLESTVGAEVVLLADIVDVGLVVSILPFEVTVAIEVTPLAVVDPEYMAVLPPGPPWGVEGLVSIVLEFAPVAERVVAEPLPLFEVTDELLLFAGTDAVDEGRPLPLVEVPVNVDDSELVLVVPPEGTGILLEFADVVVPEVNRLEADDMVFVLEVPLEEYPEEILDWIEVWISEPKELVASPPPLVVKPDIEIVDGVMMEPVNEGTEDDSALPEGVVDNDDRLAVSVSETEVVALPVAVGVKDEELVHIVAVLLGGGSVNPG